MYEPMDLNVPDLIGKHFITQDLSKVEIIADLTGKTDTDYPVLGLVLSGKYEGKVLNWNKQGISSVVIHSKLHLIDSYTDFETVKAEIETIIKDADASLMNTAVIGQIVYCLAIENGEYIVKAITFSESYYDKCMLEDGYYFATYEDAKNKLDSFRFNNKGV